MNAKRKLDERAELLFEMVDEARERERARKSEAELLEDERRELEDWRRLKEDLLKLGRETVREHTPLNTAWYQLLERLFVNDQLDHQRFHRLIGLWNREELASAKEADARDRAVAGMTKEQAQKRAQFARWLEVARWDDRADYDAEVVIDHACGHPALTDAERETLREFFAFRYPEGG